MNGSDCIENNPANGTNLSKGNPNETKAAQTRAPMKDDKDTKKEEDKEKEETEGKKEKDVEKADASIDDLMKGLAHLEAVGKKASLTRKDELIEKARGNTKLSAAELAELNQELTGNRAQAAVAQNPDISKALDLSEPLDKLASTLASVMDKLSERIEKAESHHGEFEQELAKSLGAMGKVIREQQGVIQGQQDLIKTLDAKIEKALDGPARAPKAEARASATDRPTELSTTVDPKAPAADSQINKNQFVRVLERMHMDNMRKGLQGIAPGGANIKKELSNLLSGGEPSPSIVRDVADYLKAARS